MRVSLIAAMLLSLLTCAAGAAGMYVYLNQQYDLRSVARRESPSDPEERSHGLKTASLPTDQDVNPANSGGGNAALETSIAKPAETSVSGTTPPKTESTAQANQAPAIEKPAATAKSDEEARLEEAKKAAEAAKKEVEELGDIEKLLAGRVEFSATVSGTVTDGAGNPVAGADVYADINERLGSENNVMMVSFSDSGEKVATTDGGGNFSGTVKGTVGEKSAVTLVMRAKAKGYAESKKVNVEAKNGDTKTDIKLVLQGAGSVRGRVVDASGLGVAGVTVSLSSQRNNGGFGEDIVVMGGIAKNSGTTDSTGTYVIEDVAEGSYTLNLRAPGFREKSGPRAVDVKPAQVTQLDSDFVLAATTCLRAKLVGADGKPLQGWATIELTPGNGGNTQRLNAMVGEDGNLAVNDPPIGDFNVVVKLWGYFDSASSFNVFTQDQTTDLGTIAMTPNPEAGKGAKRVRVGKAVK